MVKTNHKPLKTKLPKLTPTQKYWDQVDQQTHHLVADILNKILPLPDLKDQQNLDLDRDTDYQELFFAYETNYSQAESLPKCEVLAEEIAYEYLLLVVKSLLSNLSGFNCHLDFEGLIPNDN